MKNIVYCVAVSMTVVGCGFAGLTDQFLAEQVDNPLNPVTSYNLGIAALDQKQYANAERHFSLAVDLYDRENTGIIPAYFSWADTASLQLIEMLQEQKELKDAALDTAIKRAVDAGNRYGNVLVFDAEHTAARERKKIVDRLRALLEQRKKQQEEEKKEENKSEDKNQQSDESQEGDKENQGDNQKDDQPRDQKEGGSKRQDGKQKPSEGDQKQDESHSQQQKKESEEQQSSGDKQEEEQPAKSEEKEGSGQTGEDQTGEEKTGEEKKQDVGAEESQKTSGEQEGAVSEEELKEAMEQAMAAPQQYDANAEMVKKRAMVLLDKLQQDEAALQKQQLLKKSAQKAAEHVRYNQW
ncbi:MAG: hypothetical protein QG604_735 [Candidatus Dependentiae bacterium]|nr:hypothetical protein [Candidatus Dependentiae bacterium]